MSSNLDFVPKYAQPFTLEQAMALEIDTLVAEIARLENSIQHLLSTQNELKEFLEASPEDDEDGEMGKALKENEVVIASQTERIELIKVALMNKVGPEVLSHYGIQLDEKLEKEEVNGRDGERAEDAPMDEGLHL